MAEVEGDQGRELIQALETLDPVVVKVQGAEGGQVLEPSGHVADIVAL